MEQAEGVENKTREHVERMKAKTRMQMGGVKDKTLIKLGKEAKQNSNSTRTAKLTWPRTKIPKFALGCDKLFLLSRTLATSGDFFVARFGVSLPQYWIFFSGLKIRNVEEWKRIPKM